MTPAVAWESPGLKAGAGTWWRVPLKVPGCPMGRAPSLQPLTQAVCARCRVGAGGQGLPAGPLRTLQPLSPPGELKARGDSIHVGNFCIAASDLRSQVTFSVGIWSLCQGGGL